VNVVYVNPPSPFLVSDRGAPALGILHLAAACREQGHRVRVWDLTGQAVFARLFGVSPDTFAADRAHRLAAAATVPHEGVDLFAITATSAQYHEARNVLAAVREVAPTVPVIIGGPHASALPEEVLRDGFHAVFAGEADLALAPWIAGGCPPGLFRAVAPADLDRLPLPARDLIDLGAYCANLTVGSGLATTVHASRGCPFACAYCDRSLGDKARLYRVRSPELVVRELAGLEERHGIRRFVFTDDIFGLKRPWLQRFCELMMGRGWEFRCNVRANTLYHNLLPAMAQAGCRAISFGFESGDDRVLDQISKSSVAKNREAVRACHEAGIQVKAYFIWGFPDDDEESAARLVEFIEEARPDSSQIATLVPLPGTPLYRQAVAQGFVADYASLYHNGRDRRGGDLCLPWWREDTLVLRDALIRWIEAHERRPQPRVACPLALDGAASAIVER
jgi:radical SAM superfamily enzyme YgiQ (UPF0313 family)